MFHVFPVTFELYIDEELGIFPSLRAYLERRARNFSKTHKFYLEKGI